MLVLILLIPVSLNRKNTLKLLRRRNISSIMRLKMVEVRLPLSLAAVLQYLEGRLMIKEKRTVSQQLMGSRKLKRMIPRFERARAVWGYWLYCLVHTFATLMKNPLIIRVKMECSTAVCVKSRWETHSYETLIFVTFSGSNHSPFC